MSNNEPSSVDWLVSVVQSCIAPDYIPQEIVQQAKAMHKQEIMKAYLKHLPIEDGVITAVQKAEQYYKEKYGKETN